MTTGRPLYFCEPFRLYNWSIDKDTGCSYKQVWKDRYGKQVEDFFVPKIGTIMTFKFREWSRVHERCKDTCDVLWDGYEFQEGDHILITARRFTGYPLPSSIYKKDSYTYAVIWKGYLLNNLEFFDLL